MRKSKGNSTEGTQLSLITYFDACDYKCDLFLNKLILEAKNTRYLITRVNMGDLKPKVIKYWDKELSELLDLYAELCYSIKSRSFKYYHYSLEDFQNLWAYNPNVNLAECVPADVILSHYTGSMDRLKSAIMSQSHCLKDSGSIVDKILDKLLLNSRLLQSFYL